VSAAVFDSSALLATAFDEVGAVVAARALSGSSTCTVNVCEIVSRFTDLGASEEDACWTFWEFGLDVHPFDGELAIAAGLLRRSTRDAGLSLGDRACIALALRERAKVITADRSWADLELQVEIALIR